MKKHFLLIFTALLMGFSMAESFAEILPKSVPDQIVNKKLEPVYFTNLPKPSPPAFYTWSIQKPGSLPPGLTLNQVGVLSGVPIKEGSFMFKVVCKNGSLPPVLSDPITINVTRAPRPNIHTSHPMWTSSSDQLKLPEGQMDVPYVKNTGGVNFYAEKGIPFLPTPDKPTGYNWSLSSGKIPTGMTFNTVGALSGIPRLDPKLSGNFTQNQTFTFNITATDAVLGNNTKTFTLKINPPEKPKILSDCPLPDGYQGALYPIVFLKAVKGKKEYSWSVSPRTPSPTLGANEFNRFPDGLKLSKAGVISGTPILPGKFFFRLTVTDANGLSDEKDCSITIIPAPSIPDTEFPTCWTANKSIDQFCLTAKDGKPGYTWTIVGQSLPKDLVIDKNTGCITGVCKQSGNFSVIVKVTDKNGVSTQKTFSVEVHAPLVITTTCPLPDGDVGKPYSAYLTATGGKQPYTWKIFPQIYISDYSNNVIRKFSEKGNVITYAGNGNSASVDGTLTTSSFHNPYGIGFDPNGNIYVADYTSGKIRKISSSGSVTTLPGTYGSPEDMVADSSGNVYVSSTSDNSIWKTKEGGTASQLTSSALINHPQGICWDWDGDMILANLGALNILKINPSGTVSIVAGSTGAFTHPHDVKVDFAGNIYVADWSNAIKKITPTGVVSTLASCGVGEPYCLSVDNQGYVYFTNAIQNKIKKASPAGTVTTIAGTGAAGLQNGPALSATFNSPHSVDVNPYEDLPRGLKLNPDTGEISGTPEQPGLYKIIYEVTDACGNVATKNCTMTIASNKPEFAFELPWKLTDEGAIAVGHDGSKRNYTSATIPAGGLWSVEPDNLTLKVIWENSDNCPGGSNPNTQSATATINMTTTVAQKIGLDWVGIGELQAPNFETMQVYIDGNLIGSAQAAGGNQGCAMGPVISVNNYPAGYVLPAGNHIISITATTDDGAYHVGAYYQFSFTLVE